MVPLEMIFKVLQPQLFLQAEFSSGVFSVARKNGKGQFDIYEHSGVLRRTLRRSHSSAKLLQQLVKCKLNIAWNDMECNMSNG